MKYHSFNAFNRFFDSVKDSIKTEFLMEDLGSEQINERLYQIYNHEILINYIDICRNNQNFSPDKITLGRNSIFKIKKNKIFLTKRRILKEMLRIGFMIIRLTIGLFLTPKKELSATKWSLFFINRSEYLKKNKKLKFVEFVRESNISTKNQMLICGCEELYSCDNNFIFCDNPVMYAARNGLCFFSRIKIILCALKDIIRLLYSSAERASVLMLSKDVISFHILNKLDLSGKLKSIYITNSSYPEQTLWMRSNARSCSTHMLWYSENSRVMYHENEQEDFYPGFKYMAEMNHIVWTRSFELYLKENGVKGDFSISSRPITFEGLSNKKNIETDKEIIIFDVTPFFPPHPYYTEENMRKFLLDVISCVSEVNKKMAIGPVKILLKPKRFYSDSHDKGYINLISDFVKDGLIETIHHDAPFNDVFTSNRICISIPFTSTAILAEYYGIPSIYYDPTGEIGSHIDEGSHTKFIKSKEIIYSTLYELLNGEIKQ